MEELFDGDTLDQWSVSERENWKYPDPETLAILNEKYNYDEEIIEANQERADFAREERARFNALPSHDPVKLDEFNLMEHIAEQAKKREETDPVTVVAEKKLNLENIPEYSGAELALMEDAYLYQLLVDKNPDLEKLRPLYADGKPISDKFIKEQAVEWEKCKQKNLWKRYTKEDIKMMQSCSTWQRVKDRIAHGVQSPSGLDKEPLKNKEIKELAAEFSEIITKNPGLYIKLQIENGGIYLENLSFKKTDHRGKSEWASYKKYNQNGVTKSIKFVSQGEPVEYKNGKTAFMVQESITTAQGKIIFIKTINEKNLAETFTPQEKQKKPPQNNPNNKNKK